MDFGSDNHAAARISANAERENGALPIRQKLQ
jgi:hypothetical protein